MQDGSEANRYAARTQTHSAAAPLPQAQFRGKGSANLPGWPRFHHETHAGVIDLSWPQQGGPYVLVSGSGAGADARHCRPHGTIRHGTRSMTMTANYGNSPRNQRSIRSDESRPATKDSESEAATPPADEKLRLVQAKTRTPIASHITAFFEQRLPIERRASENTRDSLAGVD